MVRHRLQVTVVTALWCLALLPAQAFDRDTYVVRERAISHEHPLSFSIDYPRTWKLLAPQSPPHGEFMVWQESPFVCSFVSAEGNSITVQRIISRSPKEAGADFERLVGGGTIGFVRKRLEPVTTKSGAAGYTLVWEQDSIREAPSSRDGIQRRILTHDYFFTGHGAAGVQITVTVQPGFEELGKELNSLVLESLRL
jgi:hypothetical protein